MSRVLWYRFSHWVLRWVSDGDGDIGFQILGILTFIKYKHDTLVYVGRNYSPAGKWQGNRNE